MDQPVPKMDEAPVKEQIIDIGGEAANGFSPSLQERFELVKNAKQRPQTRWPRIPKVPHLLRDSDESFNKCYEPKVISLGPYHHNKPHLQDGEMLKPLCVQMFLLDSKQDIENLYCKISTSIPEVRECYDKTPTDEYCDEKLAWMMLLDGCALLHLIHCVSSGKEHMFQQLGLKNHHVAFVQQDLFLLENQLPFQLLNLLLEKANVGAKESSTSMKDMIKNFITYSSNAIRPPGSSEQTKLDLEEGEPSHLLDLLRSALLGKYKEGRRRPQQQEAGKQQQGSQLQQQEEGKQEQGSPLRQQEAGKKHQGSQPRQKEAGKKHQGSQPRQQGDGSKGCGQKCFNRSDKQAAWQSYRNIKELVAAGIFVRPSASSFLTDISFENSFFFFGCLKLPPITIDDSTKPKLLNLVAYEMCPDAPNDFGVTNYVCFLDSLIDHADDVKELRSERILYNLLGSDDEVAKFFNEIATDLVVTDEHAYRHVKKRIQQHYNNKVNTWISQVLHEHFSTPWTVMAFTGAVVALVLTGIQTYFTFPGKGG